MKKKPNGYSPEAILISWIVLGLLAVIVIGKFLSKWIEWGANLVPSLDITIWLWIASIVAVTFLSLKLLGRNIYKRKAHREIRWKRIILHVDTLHDRKKVERFVHALWQGKRSSMSRLLKGREWFQLLATSVKGNHPDGDIMLYIGYPQDRESYIQTEIFNTYPNAEMVAVPHDEVPMPYLGKGYGGRLTWQYDGGLPLKEFDGNDQISTILSHLKPGAFLSIAFSPVTTKKMNQIEKDMRDSTVHDRKGGSRFQSYIHAAIQASIRFFQPNPPQQTLSHTMDTTGTFSHLKNRFRGAIGFDVNISVWHEEEEHHVVHALVNSLNTAITGENGLRLIATKTSPIQLAPYPKDSKVMTWVGKELSNLIHFPKGKTKWEKENRVPHVYDRIPHLIQGQNSIKADDFKSGVPFGYFVHPAFAEKMLYIAEKKLRKMMLVLGKIGSGKTALILMMIRLHLIWKLVKKEPIGGLTFIDPKADAVLTALTYIRMIRVQGHEFDESKVHYFHMMSEEYCPGLNLLERLPGQDEETLITNVIDILQNAYQNESAWVRKYARPTIKALLRDKHETHTILAIPEFLRKNSPLRLRIMYQLQQGDMEDQALFRKLSDLSDKWGGHETEPLLNRLDELLESPVTQRIFGQKKTNLEVLKYMEEGHLVFFNVEGLKKEAMKLVMGYIAVLYHQAAQVRNNKSLNHYLVIDEAHEVQLPVLYEQIIPKDRSKGLIAILMTQFLDQFIKPLRMAITEVSGHIFSFTCGAETATEVQKFTGNRFKAEDIINLRELHAAVYTESESGEKVTFQIRSEPPFVMNREGKPTYFGEDEERGNQEMREAFQEALDELGKPWMKRDCLSVQEVQDQINAYREKLWSMDEKLVAWGMNQEQSKSNSSVQVNPTFIPESLPDEPYHPARRWEE